MNWTQFLFDVTVIYGIYYALNVLFDFFIQGRAPTTVDEGMELVFEEDSPSERVTDDLIATPVPVISGSEPTGGGERPVISSGPLQSTGGITIKELVSLAQNNVIEYTKAIPY